MDRSRASCGDRCDRGGTKGRVGAERAEECGDLASLGLWDDAARRGGGGGLLAQGIASDDSVAEGLGKVLAGAGLSVGPSAGHFYAEEYEHAFLMSMGRVLFLAWTLGTLDGAIEDRRAPNSGEGSVALMGGIGWAALALYDLLDADDAARRYSEGPPTGYEMELRAGFMPLAGRGRLGVGFWVAY
ncbi:MAG: hypothetical protein HYY13_02580 [Nitrospirae bacterium]|nr:hypothetical protein [Nitrospirota bacterium]